jgi:hypothetical protein
MNPGVTVLEPGLVVFKIYKAGFVADRPSKSFGRTCVWC